MSAYYFASRYSSHPEMRDHRAALLAANTDAEDSPVMPSREDVARALFASDVLAQRAPQFGPWVSVGISTAEQIIRIRARAERGEQ